MSLCSFIESCHIYPPVRNAPASGTEGSKTSLSLVTNTDLEIFHLVVHDTVSRSASTKHTHDQPMTASHAPASP